ncbi:hypothetical protein [Chryseobacterium schmidteae]|uniref:hypothetical protein n=1 Tax=Chryseobacterium schmidteae TaxID=2730404 RepID=UPI00158D6A00|nr:hypothetical protein [Chryseobacterium schmidteae]
MNLAVKIVAILKVLDEQIVSNRRNKHIFLGLRISKITVVFFVLNNLKLSLNYCDFFEIFKLNIQKKLK